MGFLPVLMRHYKEVKSIKIRRSKTIYFDVTIGYVQNPNKLPKHGIRPHTKKSKYKKIYTYANWY